MIISCVQCSKKFEIDSTLIPVKGRLLQCSACQHQWFFKILTDDIKDIDYKIEEEPTINAPIEETLISSPTEAFDYSDTIEETLIPSPLDEIIETKISENNINKKTDINNLQNKKKIGVLNFIIIFIISFIALIVLLDTFKYQLNVFIPGFDLILYSLYETLKDVYFFINDLF